MGWNRDIVEAHQRKRDDQINLSLDISIFSFLEASFISPTMMK